MADIRITALPAATVINPDVDVFPLVTNSGTVTSKSTITQSFGVALNSINIPSITATVGSSGITIGKPIILNSDGTISQVAGTNSVVGASGSVGNVSTPYVNMQGAYIGGVSQVLVVYQETSTNTIQVMAGTLAGTTITFGTPTTLATGATSGGTFPTITYVQNTTNQAVVSYSLGSTGVLYARVIQVTNVGVITVGTAFQVDSVNTTNQAVAASAWVGSPTVGKVCLAYQTVSAGIYAATFTLSGTTISSVSAQQISTTTTGEIDLINVNGTNVVALYQNDVTGTVSFLTWNGTGLTFNATTEISGLNLSANTFAASALTSGNLLVSFAEHTTGVLSAFVLGLNYTTYAVTFGGRQLIDTAPALGRGTLSNYTYPNGTVGIFYESQALNALKTTVVQVNSGNTLKIDGVLAIAQNAAATALYTFPTINALQNVVLYFSSVNSQKYMVYTASSTNLTDSNFLGFSANGYSAGYAYGIVYTYGRWILGQTGLTPGLRYYVTETGGLSLTPGVPEVAAGTAISTTSLLMNA